MRLAFLTALQFLTQLPVQLPSQPSARQLGQSLLFYPLVGAIIALFLGVILWLLPDSQPWITAGLLLIVWITATGGLHLDGLADSADAWLGGVGNKQRTLQIMKDPAAGPIAVITLTSVLILKFALLYSVVIEQNWLALFWACVLARLAMPLLFLTTPYIRENGLGSVMAKHLPAQPTRVLLAIVSLIALFSIGLFPLLGLLLIFLLLRYLMEQRLAGFTGDTAGAMLEILEVSALVFLLI